MSEAKAKLTGIEEEKKVKAALIINEKFNKKEFLVRKDKDGNVIHSGYCGAAIVGERSYGYESWERIDKEGKVYHEVVTRNEMNGPNGEINLTVKLVPDEEFQSLKKDPKFGKFFFITATEKTAEMIKKFDEEIGEEEGENYWIGVVEENDHGQISSGTKESVYVTQNGTFIASVIRVINSVEAGVAVAIVGIRNKDREEIPETIPTLQEKNEFLKKAKELRKKWLFEEGIE